MECSSLRILVVLPMYGGSLPIGRYCAQALKDMGHSVRCFEAQKLYAGYQGIKSLDLPVSRFQAAETSYLKFISQTVVSMVEAQKPHIVLAMAQAPLDRHALLRIRQTGARTVMWFVEDYKVFNYWMTIAPLYDAFAVIQKDPFLQELARIGQNNAFYLPLAALPEFHKEISLDSDEMKYYGADISFMGAGYPNRRLAFRMLADKNFKIWGSDWDEERQLAKNIQKNGERVSEEESVKIYNAAKINLNLHSSLGVDSLVSGGDFVNPRTFELAAMGAFQLVDKRSLMAGLFEANELATFDNIQDLYNLVDFFLAHPEERQKYARRAKERVLKDHTYQRRMAALLNYLAEKFGPFENPDECHPAMEDVPPELRTELAQVIKKLGLTPEAPFADVAAALRSQSGELDDVETAILFLDEWQKQYKK